VNPYVTKAVRQAAILRVLTHRPVYSQAELIKLLADEGLQVTQGTLSRDLVEIGVVRLRGENGNLVYIVPGEGGERIKKAHVGAGDSPDARLTRLAQELLISAEPSAKVVLVQSLPGAAQFLASAIDHAEWHSVLGTVAGDDSILIVCRKPAGGEALAAQLLALIAKGDD
jgi:transcriptional regulator of arginine metabolism